MSQEMNSAQPSAAGGAPEPLTPSDSMVVHTRARQLLDWLLPALAKFPREHRHTVTAHMARLAMQVLDALVAARHQRGAGRQVALQRADMALDQLRQYGHLAWGWRWWTDAQLQHFGRLCDALGRPLGGWQRSLAARDGR